MKIRDALPWMIMSGFVNAKNANGKANLWEQRAR